MHLAHAQGDALEGGETVPPGPAQTKSDVMPYDEGVRPAQLSFGQPLTKEEGIRYPMFKIIHAVGVGEFVIHRKVSTNLTGPRPTPRRIRRCSKQGRLSNDGVRLRMCFAKEPH